MLSVLFVATRVCKPGSVLTAIYLALQLPAGSSRLLETVGQTICFSTALLRDRVYIVKPMLPWAGWALTPPFHPYIVNSRIQTFPLLRAAKVTLYAEFPPPIEPACAGLQWGPFRGAMRYISVALVLRSPSAGVTRYPCPVEPGLSSSAAFRPASAAVRPGRGNIVLQGRPNVKYPCKIF